MRTSPLGSLKAPCGEALCVSDMQTKRVLRKSGEVEGMAGVTFVSLSVTMECGI